MRRMQHVLAVMAVAALGSLVAFAQAPQQPAAGSTGSGPPGGAAPGRGGPAGPASFFITSVGKGDGANYGGLAGADAYCAQMAQGGGIADAAGTHVARVSEHAGPGRPAGGQRARPHRRRARGTTHAARSSPTTSPTCTATSSATAISINKTFALNEKGTPVNGVGDMPNQHDILTGSDSTRPRASPATVDTTCNNYTSNRRRRARQRRVARPPRSHRRRQLVVERRAQIARLQPAEPGRNRRRGSALLLRGELERSDRSCVRVGSDRSQAAIRTIRTNRTTERSERDLFFDLPVGERLRAELDVGDIRIAVRGRHVARLLLLRVLTAGSLLLTAFDAAPFRAHAWRRWVLRFVPCGAFSIHHRRADPRQRLSSARRLRVSMLVSCA